ncbi:nucleoside hydrolase [uncultured Alistipes sp.]|jgi:inosine-uridine nucleoside N-ribohydrolase|uniref:nucleoside hydrolase n=1 Tax=uncultured Alistipes sp. TaxID=538949 RepID=UPI0025D85596|nr:nucleoside hydrolase [uncultured Alistipes sp.]
MKRLLIVAAFSAVCMFPARAQQTAPLRVIFETDMGNDVDDPLAIDMLYKAMDRSEIDLLAVVSNKDCEFSARYIDILNTWYGYPGIPIGKVRNGVTIQPENYARTVCEMDIFPRSRKDKAYEDPVRLYRRLLAASPDNSVVIISVGFSTNLGRLLESGADKYSPLGGVELLKQKASYLSVMGGSYGEKTRAEYNIVHDIANAKRLFALCPVPIVVTPFELGKTVYYPGESIANDFTWSEKHPMVEGYKAYRELPYDRPTWDMMSVLYVLHPTMFGTTEPGIICVDDEGYTYFTPTPRGKHKMLTATPEQTAAILEFFVKELSSKPANYK